MVFIGVQFAAWVLMFACEPVRPIYFLFYYPISLLFPGPHYSRYGLGFFILYLPITGTLLYGILFSSLATLVTGRHRRRPSNVAENGGR